MNRRDFLKTTAITAAGMTMFPRFARAATPPRRFVFINLGGGWDTTYSIDPKPGMATVSQAPGQLLQYGNNLRVWDWRPPVVLGDPDSNVKQFFDAYSSMSCIVKGINLRSVSHDLCAQRIYTGRQGGLSPDMATIIGFEKAKDLPVPFLLLNGPAWAGPYGAAVGRVGETGQLRTLIDPLEADFLSFRANAADEADIEAFHLATSERQRAIRGSVGYNKARIDDYQKSLGRGDELRDKGKNLDFGGGGLIGQIDTALAVFDLNLAACIMVDSGYGFDTHAGNIAQGPSQDGVFAALKYLADQLATRDSGLTPGSKMLDDTCVVVLSEMTRTPRLNGGAGKDHWPVGACFLFGAGVNGGRQVGETGDGMVAMPLDLTTGDVTGSQNPLVPMSTEMFVAGMLTLAGIDSTKYFGTGTPALTAIVKP